MLYSLAPWTAPYVVSVVAKPKYMAITMEAIEDDLWDYTMVVRYTSLSDANADANRNLVIQTYESAIRDHEELTAGSVYYYRTYWVDIFGNASALSTEQHATYKRVQDADTDDTAPSTPSAPTLTQVAKDVDEDGKVDIAVKVTWSAATSAKGYEVEITQGSDVWYEKSKNRSLVFKAKSNKLYSVKVSAISFNGTASAFSAATTITPSKKSATVVAPTSLSVAGGSKRNKLSWSESTEADYKTTKIYRSPNATWASAVALDRIKGTAFVDDNLTGGTSYYYYVAHIDTSGNESAVYPTSAGSGVIGTPGTLTTSDLATGSVTDAITDQTAPSVPSAPTLTQAARDVDEDGKVDIAIAATWSALTSAKSYELEITEAGTVIDNLKSTALKKLFKAKSAKLYSVRIRGLSFNGTPGSWSSAVTLTPGKKSAVPSTASGLAVVPKPKSMSLTWTKCADTDYKETVVYRFTSNTVGSAVEINRIKGAAYPDNEELTVGSTYYYWVAHVDTSGNEGAKSSVASGVYKAAANADIGALAVGGGNLQTGAASPRVLTPSDTSNKVVDDQLFENSSTFWLGTGVITQAANTIVGSQSIYQFSMPASTTANYDIIAATGRSIPVEAGKQYVYSAWVGGSVGISDTYQLYINWYSDAAATVFVSGAVYASAAHSGVVRKEATVTAPAGAVRAVIACRKAGTANSNLIFSGPVFTKSIENANVSPLAIATGNLQDSAVTPAKSDLGDTSNLLKANQCDNTALWTTTANSGASAVTLTTLANTGGSLGSSRSKLRLSALLTTISQSVDVATTAINVASPSKRHTFSAQVNLVSTTSGNPGRATLYVDWYGLDGSGNLTFLSTAAETDTAAPVSIGVTSSIRFATTAPSNAVFFVLRIRFSWYTSVSSGTYVFDIGSPDAYVSDSGIFETITPVGNETVAASATKIFIQCRSNHTKSARYVQFAGAMKNNSGGTRAVTWEFIKIADPAGAAVITSLKSLTLTATDDLPIYMEFFDNAPSGDFTDYAIRITAGGANSFQANSRYMITQAFQG